MQVMSDEARRHTTVRSTHPAASDWLVRSGLRALGVVAPPLAAEVALGLFSRPPRRRTPDDALAAIAGGRELAVKVDGASVRAWWWGEGAPVLLVHGWGGHGGQLAAFVPPLLAAGVAVVAFDGPAHGASGGRTTSMPGFAKTLAALVARTGAPRGAIAHSFGAAATALALRRGLPTDPRGFRAAFVAPFTDPVRYFDLFVGSLGFGPRLAASLRARAEARYGVRWDEIDLVARARDMTVPLLVLHDRDDRALPLAESERLVGAWPGARLVATSGLGHNRLLADPSAVATAVAFVTDAEAAAAAR
jgi:pimeloyl-ACP methyl ester carboxylesterase